MRNFFFFFFFCVQIKFHRKLVYRTEIPQKQFFKIIRFLQLGKTLTQFCFPRAAADYLSEIPNV